MKKADLLLTADWHLREDSPEAWVGDYPKAQKDALEFIGGIQEENDWCPVVVAGDFYDKWKVSHEFENWVMKNLPKGKILVVPGQHDLRNHNIDYMNQTAISVLRNSGRIRLLGSEPFLAGEDADVIIQGFPWGSDLRTKGRAKYEGRRVAVAHVMTYRRVTPYPGCKADQAHIIMDKLSKMDLIVTGDNHETFTVEREERLLVNPGSLMRIKADQIDHKPSVFLWYAESNSVEQVFLPQTKGDVSREHIEIEKVRDKRVEAFVKKLKGGVEIGLSFENNLKEFMDANDVKKPVRAIINELTKTGG